MVQREPCSNSSTYANLKSIRRSRCLHIGYSHFGTGIPTSNGEYSWRSKVYSPPQSTNLSPERHRSKRLLKPISEEFDLETAADEMTMTIEHNDFQQGSSSNDEPRQRPQYGSGFGDTSFVEDDDDYEFLLDEALARDGLYRGMSSVIIFVIFLS